MYIENNLLDTATELFDECYLHNIPENIHYWIDYEKLARDCEIVEDIFEFKYAGTTYT